MQKLKINLIRVYQPAKLCIQKENNKKTNQSLNQQLNSDLETLSTAGSFRVFNISRKNNQNLKRNAENSKERSKMPSNF